MVMVIVMVVFFLQALPISDAARTFFVFGDSLVDNGNNNYLATWARADHPPYGVDFPTQRPTGRFSNGLNIPDIISEHLGAEPTMPYPSPDLDGEKLLVGANFASAGVGILNDTGVEFANVIRITKQLHYFEQYQQRLSSFVGNKQAKRLVNNALVLITLGGNDFINNYYLLPYSARSREFSLPDYIRYLISEYEKILARLYELGARRVLVTGTGPLGCIPGELALRRSRNGVCDPELQRVAKQFNPELFQMLGFVTSKIACCGQGPYNGIGLCTMLSNLCPNRDIYAFWDAFHPSERANRIIVNHIMTGSKDYMNPMNLSTILTMDPRT
ncbi:GDSL esterase/lipase At5g33370-like isoform X2 [Typha angustifolia]|uniref:GDSL esterase/lipase At5g33370-like isoform X2 n=1 Tax=Typha angustifolia TaxID=59011 RepID=UPI003C2FEE19